MSTSSKAKRGMVLGRGPDSVARVAGDQGAAVGWLCFNSRAQVSRAVTLRRRRFRTSVSLGESLARVETIIGLAGVQTNQYLRARDLALQFRSLAATVFMERMNVDTHDSPMIRGRAWL
jgi:hypothetical protein